MRKFVRNRIRYYKRHGRIPLTAITQKCHFGIRRKHYGRIYIGRTTIGEQKFSEIDMDNPASLQQVINFIMMKLMFNTLSADDITAATQGRNYTESPRGLAFWYLKNDLLYVKPDLPGIISLAMQGQGQTVDAHLIAGIADAILKSNPFLLKTLLGVVSESLDNSLLSMIANMDHQSFQMFFSWIKEGIPRQIEKENGHTHIYLNREALSPLIAFIPNLQPAMEGILTSADVVQFLYRSTV